MVRAVLKSLIAVIVLALLASCAMETREIPTASLTVKVADDSAGKGSVTGGGTYLIGSQATITATANEGYGFVRWNDYNTDATRTITVPSSNVTYTATFKTISQVTITVNSNNSYGYGSGSGTYDVGSTTTITATPYSGYRFFRWNDYNTDATRTITVPSSNVTYTAYFETMPQATITVNSSNSYGYVSGSGTYDVGSTTTITATPYSGYRFVSWNDYNTDATRTITVPYSSVTYTAYFEAIPKTTVTLNRNNTSFGTVSGSGTYDVGSTVTIKATPYTGYRFARWNDNNTNATRTITVPSSNITYTAYFEAVSLTTIFSDDFDSDYWNSSATLYAGVWNYANNDYFNDNYWYRTSSRSYSGKYSISAQGIFDTYSNNTYSELRRVLYLSNFSSATLSFKEYINTERNYDKLQVQVIYNGTTTTLYTKSGSSNWTVRTVDLSPYAGKTITLVFKFSSDSYVVPSSPAGVWLDDISVTAR